MHTLTNLAVLAYLAPAAPAVQDAEGLTLAEVLGNLPTDPASIFVMLLLFGSLAGILWVGRSKGPKVPGGGA